MVNALQAADLNSLAGRELLTQAAEEFRRQPGELVSGLSNEPRRAGDIAEQIERFVARRDEWDMWES